MIKNIVFDLGNVLTSFRPEEYFLTFFEDEKKTKDLCTKVFCDASWQKYDQGIYLKEDLLSNFQQRFPQDIEAITMILDNWLCLLQPMTASFEFMKQLKREGYRIYILSNLSKDSADHLKKTNTFFSVADGAVLSYEEKLNKPDPEIYHILLERYRLSPDETVFLDDSSANIEQARCCGIHGVVFRDILQAKEEVRTIIGRMQEC